MIPLIATHRPEHFLSDHISTYDLTLEKILKSFGHTLLHPHELFSRLHPMFMGCARNNRLVRQKAYL